MGIARSHILPALFVSLMWLRFGMASNGTDPIILWPPSSAAEGAPEKVLVMINGAYVSNTNYVEVAGAIQLAAAPTIRLWVAIPSFLLDCPNPVQIGSKIKAALSAIEEAGFANLDPETDVVVGGHSLGGIFSQGAVVSGNYTGLLLFGSYLTSGNRVDTYPKPALTLAGELDGLTRITRIAECWRQFEDLLAVDETQRFSRSVVALPGQTHSQFCSNVNITSFGTKDLCPEVTWDAAHAAIGEVVADFLTLLWKVGNSDDRSSAETRLEAKLTYTESLVRGFLTAQEAEAQDWCGQSQAHEAVNFSTVANISITVSTCSNFASFDVTSPSIVVGANGTSVLVTAVDETELPVNPTDVSTVDMAATEIDCKILTSAALAHALDQPAPASPSSTCQGRNVEALAWAQSLVSQATARRYSNEGKSFSMAPDSVYSTGVTWQAASFQFDTSGDQVTVTSPRLTIGTDASSYAGDQLCKLLSPARVIEYMMVDGLPTWDACPV